MDGLTEAAQAGEPMGRERLDRYYLSPYTDLRLREVIESHERLRLILEAAATRIEQLESLTLEQAERIADQSELLSRRAGRQSTTPT